MSTAEFNERRVGVVLLEDRNHLRLGESSLPHEGLLSACGRELTVSSDRICAPT